MNRQFANLFRLFAAPSSAAVWLLLAGVAASHGTVHDRLAALDLQIAAAPNAALVLRRAALLGEHEDWAAALNECDRAQQLDPATEVDLTRGKLLLGAGRPADAVAALDRFLRHHPDHPSGLVCRARAFLELDRQPAAIADLRAAVQHSATLEPDLVVELADALAAHGEPLEAVNALDSGIAKLGAAPALAIRALELELATTNFDAALVRVAAMQSAAPRPEPWLARRAAILAQAGRLPEARAAWQSLIGQIAVLPPALRDSHALSLLTVEARQALIALPAATAAAPLKPGVERHTSLIEIQAAKVADCRKLFAAVPPAVAASFTRAQVRNLTCYLKEIGGKPYLFTYLEYTGSDYAGDLARAEATEAVKDWQRALAGLQVAPEQSLTRGEVEEVFFTAGADQVIPTPGKFTRTGMITGLKPDREAEYRTLHATTWPGVLKGIAAGNFRNFSIGLIALGDRLYLIGYLEYVGKDAAADGAAGKALAVNRRWWKFTDACQLPLPAAAAKGEIWDGMTEVYHFD